MDHLNWLPSVTTTSILFLIGWIAKRIIVTRLQRSVGHEFDTKLEVVRADLRRNEEALKAEIRARENEISILRSGAMSALANRQAGFDARRLQAIDQLWSSVVALGPAKTLCRMMTRVNFKTVESEAEKRPEVRAVFAALGAGCDPNKLDLSGAEKARPFVSQILWAYYSAYLAITSDAMLRNEMLKRGTPSQKWIDQKKINELVAKAFPHYSAFIEEQGPNGYYMLLDELEGLLLKEIEEMLAGVEADRAAVERAAEILKISKEAMASFNEMQ